MASKEYPLFAERLAQLISQRGLTYDEVARAARDFLPLDIKLSAPSVWSYTRGHAHPRRPVVFEALSEALDVDLDYLLGLDNCLPPPAALPSAAVRISDLNDGRAHLRICSVASWSVALQVLELLQHDQGGRAETERPGRSVNGRSASV